MARIAVVDGVKLYLYANEHPPPHFHALFAEYSAVIDLGSMTVTEGFLPLKKRRKVLEWAAPRRDLIIAAFHRAMAREKVEEIP